MTVTSGSVIIKKDQTNLIGISIGGGAPLCPCLYIVQVFFNFPIANPQLPTTTISFRRFSMEHQHQKRVLFKVVMNCWV